MSFGNVSQCADGQQFAKMLDAIEITISTVKTVEKPLIDKISRFFDCNIGYIVRNHTDASRFYSIAAKVIVKPSSVLKEKTHDYIKSLADGINHLAIPLSSLNLSEKELYDLIPWLSYIDLCNVDLSKYDLKKFKFNLSNTDFTLKASDEDLCNIAKTSARESGYRTSKEIKKFGIKDKTLLFEIAKLCVEQNPSKTMANIKNFEFEDAKLLEIANLCIERVGVPTIALEYCDKLGFSEVLKFEIVKLCLKKNLFKTIEYIDYFGIKEKTYFYEIARLCVMQDSTIIPENIKTFKLDDKNQLFEIAKLCAQKNGRETAKFIQNFGIEDKTDLFEIAKLCAQQDSNGTCLYLINFGIEDKAHLYEIAKICASAEGMITRYITDFGIVRESQLFELAKLSAQKCGRGTALHILEFRIKDKDKLFEIAKLCAQNSGGGTAEYIEKFGIDDKTHLFEIAKLCAQQDSDRTCLYLENFRIEDKAHLYEIAKLCATKGTMVSGCVTNFRIVEQSHLCEIAKLCAQKCTKTAKNIKNFGIKDKNELFEIAKLCAQNNGSGTAQHIENFGIEDKTHLFEIAKLCFAVNVIDTIVHFKNFGIKDKTHLYEIAMVCAKREGLTTAFYIKTFEIDNEIQLYTIAKTCALENVHACSHIKNFGLKIEQLYKLAKFCAKLNGHGTAFIIHAFGFKDEKQLLGIAKRCAQNGGGTEAHFKKNFMINDERQLLEIAKLSAQQDPILTAQYLQVFGLNEQMQWEVFLECMIDKYALGQIYRIHVPHVIFLVKSPYVLVQSLYQILESKEEEKEKRAEFFKEVNVLINNLSCSPVNKKNLLKLNEQISNFKIHIQNETALWFLRTLFYCIQMQPKDLDWMLESKLWIELAKLREPRLRSLLTAGLFEVSKYKVDVPKGTHGLPLIAIPFFQLQQQEVSPEKLRTIYRTLKKGQNKDILKNAVTLQSILHTFHLLASTVFLSSDEKKQVIDKIIGDQGSNLSTLINRINAARALLQMKKRKWLKSSQDPVAAFSALFRQLVPIKDFTGDVSVQYDKIFAKSRNPYGLITYAASLKTLEDRQVMDCLGSYVSSVFNGTFKDLRYDSTNNIHLKTISESRPNLLEIWKNDIMKPLDEMPLAEVTKEEFDPRQWIFLKLIRHEHLGKIEIPYIRDYFKANTPEEKDLILQNLNKELPSDLLNLQKLCIAFAESKSEHMNPLLKEIQACLDPLTEFAHDIKGLLESKQTSSKLKVVLTDDPIDLLLCGTDVMGSCQRLDGHPNLNKGLLGYIVDGKNRLLAIKDSKGKIVARCILRLMWDGEQPVLFRELFYPDTRNSKYVTALNQVAIDLAKVMQVPLTSADEGASYGKPLHSLGGAVYEYCDGTGGGVKKDGVYTITEARMMKEGEV